MKKFLEPGKYVVAVSGGVDSIVLLHMLVQDPELELVVAHYDHGIRPDSSDDKKFVEELARSYGLSFVYKEGRLGSKTSEAVARDHRYQFLHEVKKAEKASAIVTAHHQDDLIETTILNMARGTKYKGLVSLKSTDEIKRPLLNMSKKQILDYAKKNKLKWREDPTNKELIYARNKIRKALQGKISPDERKELMKLLSKIENTDEKIDQEVASYLSEHADNKTLDRKSFIGLPHNVAREILAAWLRQQSISFDKKTLERIAVSIKVSKNGSSIDVSGAWYLQVENDQISLRSRSFV